MDAGIHPEYPNPIERGKEEKNTRSVSSRLAPPLPRWKRREAAAAYAAQPIARFKPLQCGEVKKWEKGKVFVARGFPVVVTKQAGGGGGGQACPRKVPSRPVTFAPLTVLGLGHM